MKWYSRRVNNAHVSDLQTVRVDMNGTPLADIARIYEHVGVIARGFGREYTKIGVMDYNDLLQEGYLALVIAWEKVDWKQVAEAENPEAYLWGYLKTIMTREIRRAIMGQRSTIKIPEHNYRTSNNGIDVFLATTFTEAFGDEYFDLIDDAGDYNNDQLNLFLNDLMDELMSFKQKDILRQFYGMDEPLDKKVPMKTIAEKYEMSIVGVKKAKKRGLMRLVMAKDRIQFYLDS